MFGVDPSVNIILALIHLLAPIVIVWLEQPGNEFAKMLPNNMCGILINLLKAVNGGSVQRESAIKASNEEVQKFIEAREHM